MGATLNPLLETEIKLGGYRTWWLEVTVVDRRRKEVSRQSFDATELNHIFIRQVLAEDCKRPALTFQREAEVVLRVCVLLHTNFLGRLSIVLKSPETGRM
jgi:hypothetical protein